jgi:uncharacterized protein (TIRG00374 family)
MRGRRTILLRYAFALAALALIALTIDIEAVRGVLAKASIPWVLASFALGFSLVALNTWKWRLLIASQMRPPSFPTLLRLNFAAALYGTILPGQIAGEAVKIARIARGKRDARVLVASVLADRVTGFLGLVAVGVAGVVFGSAPSAVATSIVVVFVLSVAAAISITYVPAASAPNADRNGALVRAARSVRSVLAALAGFRARPAAVAAACVLSVLYQVGVTGTVALFARALGMDVGWLDMAWITAIVAVVQLLPITVASIGTREGALIGALAVLGITQADALALSLLVLAGNVVLAVTGAIVELQPGRWPVAADPPALEQQG